MSFYDIFDRIFTFRACKYILDLMKNMNNASTKNNHSLILNYVS